MPPASVGSRGRGRPRKDIAVDAVIDAAAHLFNEGGYDAVSIETVAEKLGVSRSTLYRRSVPTKEDLLGLLFERTTKEFYNRAQAVVRKASDPEEALSVLIHMQISTAVRIRTYLAVFFMGVGLPPDVYPRWQHWNAKYEKLWLKVVRRAMEAGIVEAGDPVVITHFLMGMVVSVARWYEPSDGLTPDEIADQAINFIRKG